MKLVEQRPRYESRSYAHLIFDTGAKYIQWRKDSLLNVAGKTGYLHAEY
jgi:hypothetical protein